MVANPFFTLANEGGRGVFIPTGAITNNANNSVSFDWKQEESIIISEEYLNW